MTALLSLLAAKATPYIIGGGAILAVWLLTVVKALSAGKAIQRAKEADSLEEHLKEIGDANVARNSVDSRVPDHDPYRRD